MPAMIVCVCNRVSDRDIQREVREGCTSFDTLQMATGVATCCGRCDSCAREVFELAQHVHAQTSAPATHRYIPLTVALTA